MKIIATDKAPAAIGPYSQGYEVGGLVITSGQLPVNPATGEMPATIAEQAEWSCKNVAAILEAAGSSLDKVVKTTCFLADTTSPPSTRSMPSTSPPSPPAAASPSSRSPRAPSARSRPSPRSKEAAMSLTLVGSHLCPDTLYALNQLCARKVNFTFRNISASLPDLKYYLALRDSSPLFDGPKASGSIGIPCFVQEDGTVTMDLEAVLS